jgi:hypothetical protein
MIRRDRAKVQQPASLNQGGAGPAERLAAKAHYFPEPEPPGGYVRPKTFGFAAYKGDDVKAALEELFEGKCAYCETFYEAGGPMDVEHYRPKGAVAEEPDHWGYWWLAAEWDNLLPSCTDCNRKRRQEIVRPEAAEVPAQPQLETAAVAPPGAGKKRARKPKAAAADSAGKKDSFPVRGPRWMTEADSNSEEDALLIDPTRRDPGQHLVFVVEKGRSLVVARPDGAAPDPYGDASIRVFGLNRVGLVRARSMQLRQLEVSRKKLRSHLRNVTAAATPAERDRWLAAAREEFATLEALSQPQQPYSAMSATFVAELKAELRRAAGR